jgi:signal peptidase
LTVDNGQLTVESEVSDDETDRIPAEFKGYIKDVPPDFPADTSSLAESTPFKIPVAKPTPTPIAAQPAEKAKPHKALRAVGNIAFYLSLAAALVVGLIYGTARGGTKTILGFSAFKVLSDSMQSVLPKGSLVITRQTDAADIQIGDDITFWLNEDTTATHRVIGIYENYEESGQAGFETRGVENPAPDPDIVYAKNVIGKVVWHIDGFGDTQEWIKDKWLIIVLTLAGVVGTAIALKIVFKKESADDDTDDEPRCKKRYKRKVAS